MRSDEGSEECCIDVTDGGQRVKNPKESAHETQLSKPARDRASYTDQYKQEERIGATVICSMAGLG